MAHQPQYTGIASNAKKIPCAVAVAAPSLSFRPANWATNVLVIPASAIKPHTNVKNRIPPGKEAQKEASLYHDKKSRSKKLSKAKLPELIIKGQATLKRFWQRDRLVVDRDMTPKTTRFRLEGEPQKQNESIRGCRLTTHQHCFTLRNLLGGTVCI